MPTINGLVIDYKTKTVCRDGKDLKLTKREYSLLCLLVSVAGKVWSKEEIMFEIWGFSHDTGSNTLEVFICLLKRKVDSGYSNKLINCKNGFGYFIK